MEKCLLILLSLLMLEKQNKKQNVEKGDGDMTENTTWTFRSVGKFQSLIYMLDT